MTRKAGCAKICVSPECKKPIKIPKRKDVIAVAGIETTHVNTRKQIRV